MKRYAIHFKNMAALFMLLALLSLLLPCVSITAGGKTGEVSGASMLKSGAGLTVEYVRNGTIKNSHPLEGGITWGDLKAAVSQSYEQNGGVKMAGAVAVAVLPVVLVFLAMIITVFAAGKVGMAFATIFTAAAAAENFLFILAFSKIRSLVMGQADGGNITPLIGIYAFTALACVALFILLILFITGGFNEPESYEESYEGDRGTKRKKHFLRRDKKSKKRRRRRGRRRDKKRKGASGKKSQDAPQNNAAGESENMRRAPQQMSGAVGKINGLTGMYQGTSMDLTMDGEGTFTLGTTPEAVNILAGGSMEEAYRLDGCNCVIRYQPQSMTYTVASHSAKDIILQAGSDGENQIVLKNGQVTTVGGNTLLFIGDLNNMVKLD